MSNILSVSNAVEVSLTHVFGLIADNIRHDQYDIGDRMLALFAIARFLEKQDWIDALDENYNKICGDGKYMSMIGVPYGGTFELILKEHLKIYQRYFDKNYEN